MKRIDLDNFQIHGDRLTLRGALHHRARNVLRIREGDCLAGTDGHGNEYTFVVTSVLAGSIEGQVIKITRGEREMPLSITLAQVVPRFSRMDFIIQKATELGVNRIIPLMAERSVARLNQEKSADRLGRWEKIASEAVTQCRRTQRPTIARPMTLDDFLNQARGTLRIVAHYGKVTTKFSELSSEHPASVDVIVGPEGGFSSREVEACQRADFTTVSLGPRVLRSETAALVVLSLIGYRWGDIE